jgi:glycosyltransferase involved in cell wall biosynthesis
MRTVVQGSMHTVDELVVNSEFTADTVERLYNREADAVIYPPTDLSAISPEIRDDDIEPYFLYLGSIDRLHRTEEVIEAFDRLDDRLIVAGDGSWLSTAKARASDNVDFRGYVTGGEKRNLLANCEGLIVSAQHSFGRVIVESLASGRPVIAANHGYAPYAIDDGETGLLYDPGVKNLVTAVERFDEYTWETEQLTAAAKPYRLDEVQTRWRNLIFE